jgi:hypothetical protein
LKKPNIKRRWKSWAASAARSATLIPVSTALPTYAMDACIFEISALKSRYDCAVRNIKSLYQ